MKFNILSLIVLAVVIFAGVCCFANKSFGGNVMSVRASHILVDTKQEAESLKTRIEKGESFETLAQEYSKCPSGRQGGDLGYFERGQMVPEFDQAAFSLPVGQISEPVQTQFGWHLIKVTAQK